jgi:hypothetical protein
MTSTPYPCRAGGHHRSHAAGWCAGVSPQPPRGGRPGRAAARPDDTNAASAGRAPRQPQRLCGLVRVHNRMSSEDARIQLRAAAHVGRVYRDDHGVTGDAASHLYRLLDAPRLKHLLAASGSELAFITSDYFYDTVIRRHPTLVDPAAFESVTVDIKHTTATGWVQLLGSASSTARVLPFDRSA